MSCHHDKEDVHIEWANNKGKNAPAWYCNQCEAFKDWLPPADAAKFRDMWFGWKLKERSQRMRKLSPKDFKPKPKDDKQTKLF